MILAILFTANSLSPNTLTYKPPQLETPSYAKWSQLAIKETQSKYPTAKIIDYLHEGSVSKGDSTTEKFKLWLKDDQHELGVIITIKYNTKTEEIVHIEFQETAR